MVNEIKFKDNNKKQKTNLYVILEYIYGQIKI